MQPVLLDVLEQRPVRTIIAGALGRMTSQGAELWLASSTKRLGRSPATTSFGLRRHSKPLVRASGAAAQEPETIVAAYPPTEWIIALGTPVVPLENMM